MAQLAERARCARNGPSRARTINVRFSSRRGFIPGQRWQKGPLLRVGTANANWRALIEKRARLMSTARHRGVFVLLPVLQSIATPLKSLLVANRPLPADSDA